MTMTTKRTIALDVMGGDNAPLSNLTAAKDFLQKYPKYKIILVGPKKVLDPFLKENQKLNLELCYAENALAMDASNLAGCRDRESSMYKTLNLLKKQTADLALSSGPTGALVAASYHILRSFPKMKKPALLATVLNVDSKPVIMLDVGANITYTADELNQLANCGSLYYSQMYNFKAPKIGLINNGTEKSKGIPLYVEANKKLAANKNINFYGNIEAFDILNDNVQVAIGDGFAMNIALKSMEAGAETAFKILKKKLTSSFFTKIKALLIRSKMRELYQEFNPKRFNGAVIMGIQGLVFKSHGSSDAEAMLNALTNVKRALDTNLLDTLKEGFS